MPTYKKITEVCFLGICLFLFWKLYIPISTLTSLQNTNNAKYIVTAWDMAIPYISYPIWAYHFAFLLIPFALFALAMSLLHNMELIRGLLLGFVVMLTIGYVIYFVFPVSVILYKSIPAGAHEPGFLNQLVLASYGRIAPWNDFPSMHIATGWFTFRAIQMVVKNKFFVVSFFLWFIVMAIGTLTLQFHCLADVAAGLVLAEGCFRWSYYKHPSISTVFEKMSFRLRMSMCVILIGVLSVTLHYAGEYQLHQVTLKA